METGPRDSNKTHMNLYLEFWPIGRKGFENKTYECILESGPNGLKTVRTHMSTGPMGLKTKRTQMDSGPMGSTFHVNAFV